MASGLDNSEDSHLGKNVQTNDQKEEVAIMDNNEKNIEIEKEKVQDGGSNHEGEDERKTGEGRKNGEEKEKGLNRIDVGVESDEAKKGDVKEINDMKNEAKEGDDAKVINEMKNDIGAEKGDSKVINEMNDNIEGEKGDVKDVINEIKNGEARKGDDIINEGLMIDEKKKEDKESEAIRKEDEKKLKEIEMSVAQKEDDRVKGGEAKEKDEKNESKAIEEEKNSEDVKERVVKMDQNRNFVEENSELKKNGGEREEVSSCNVDVSRLSFTEESNLFSDLKENEKKALVELRSKVEEAINGNQLFQAKENDIKQQSKEKSSKNGEKEMEKPKENDGKEDAKDEGSTKKNGQESEEESLKYVKDDMEEERDVIQEGVEKEKVIAEAEQKKMQENYIDKDIKLWGVPLLPSKGGNATDVVLLKFLRARDFKVSDALEMLRNTLQWRKQNNMDSILDEDVANDFQSTAYINGSDRQGHPVCYNIFGVLGDDEMYNKTLGTEENREKFLRWRLQLMEEGIEKLDFIGVSALMQINDLMNSPGPSKKEVRLFMKQVVGILQDNYPEFVVKNVSNYILHYKYFLI